MARMVAFLPTVTTLWKAVDDSFSEDFLRSRLVAVYVQSVQACQYERTIERIVEGLTFPPMARATMVRARGRTPQTTAPPSTAC